MINFSEVSEVRKYMIVEVNNPNPKFSGLGISPGNIIEVISFTSHLIRFCINNTYMFARRSDIKMSILKI